MRERREWQGGCLKGAEWTKCHGGQGGQGGESVKVDLMAIKVSQMIVDTPTPRSPGQALYKVAHA
jgi:hypothetical protein